MKCVVNHYYSRFFLSGESWSYKALTAIGGPSHSNVWSRNALRQIAFLSASSCMLVFVSVSKCLLAGASSPVDSLCFYPQLSLWGNKMDLSMVATVDNYDTSNVPLSTPATTAASATSTGSHVQLLRTNLLSDHTSVLWDLMELLRQPKSESESRRIDFVLDNSGLELFSDLCFADWLLSTGLADRVMLHFKQMPWFVSDAMIADFDWMVSQLLSSDDKNLSSLGEKWRGRVQDGTFVLTDHTFWTTSYEYAAMSTVARDLYTLLSQSFLVIFKGDLNYRKLLADRNWQYTENFSIALGGFEPTNVCALRTLKADLVTGLPPGAASKAAGENKDWMVTGQYAVCQVNHKK